VSEELDSPFHAKCVLSVSRILTVTSNDHHYGHSFINSTSSPVFYYLMVRKDENALFTLHFSPAPSRRMPSLYFSISVSLISFESFSTFLPGHVQSLPLSDLCTVPSP